MVQDSCHGTGVDKFCLSQSFFVCQNCKEIACLLACLLAGWPAGWLACQSSPWTWQWRLIGLHESNSAELYGVLIGGFCIIVLVFLFSCCCSTSNQSSQTTTFSVNWGKCFLGRNLSKLQKENYKVSWNVTNFFHHHPKLNFLQYFINYNKKGKIWQNIT